MSRGDYRPAKIVAANMPAVPQTASQAILHKGLSDASPFLRHVRWVVHRDLNAIFQLAFVDDAGSSDDQIQVVFSLQTLTHNVHVQQTQEAATKAETQTGGDLPGRPAMCELQHKCFRLLQLS